MALTLGLLAPAAAAQHHENRFDAIVELTQAKMREFNVPGVAIGIFDNGVITTRGLGVTNIEDPLPVTDHTVFPIASISKTFAATMMMRLAEQGKVDLKAPVRKYLPDFKVRDAAVSREVTVWNLLTHTGRVGRTGLRRRARRGYAAQFLGDRDARPDAGRAAGRRVELQQRRLQRVGPRDRGGDRHARSIARSATWSSRRSAWRTPAPPPASSSSIASPPGHAGRGGAPATLQRPFSPSVSVTAGGVGLCITDLMNYAKFHLGDGTAPTGERLLRRASLELMRTTQLHKQGTDDDIGIAWHLRNVGPLRVAAHGGTLAGHILLLELSPRRTSRSASSPTRSTAGD